ncbi:hypothetical protein A3H10_04675 [Candidatus Uhrbacteria bacterium RIFCSPLOWO2_12_FULL_46_10]|uniref:Uncharacterized protein n=1 Tax=Candidatus Uhrbacteria bacterium RIFCSPLOWO2_01_FULL_47_25 TaxID=1802402 RepID=A0A1F7UX54_9BACT|nr:MAG: hypothetical protein A3D60_03265 [Candidatus Uhrbacteria bacterium RIFCSPHIGHO2_02_FULL_47_29]OGL82870.1 MAG: hypothetical protein A2936_04365 [Candidatus Uhrbacteria bacterium RIFCSPLOWO2_01_FULL_47_25]OGL85897.1 MAG: hypothetical protein A3I37_00895 [Candidatus Uhrbacteria bacterium RIFCSPLOWO2_02_FULL_46_19]OGL91054.1 MAG: hypothetical protein A3H10_04675 [Candidatus Uhrbacteria bacterium RIFCSPLOWO2_12_FULL_46_10]
MTGGGNERVVRWFSHSRTQFFRAARSPRFGRHLFCEHDLFTFSIYEPSEGFLFLEYLAILIVYEKFS